MGGYHERLLWEVTISNLCLSPTGYSKLQIITNIYVLGLGSVVEPAPTGLHI